MTEKSQHSWLTPTFQSQINKFYELNGLRKSHSAYFDFNNGNWCFANDANVEELDEEERDVNEDAVWVPEGGGGGFIKLT